VAVIVFDMEAAFVEVKVPLVGETDEDWVAVAEGALLLELPAADKAVVASAEICRLVGAVLPLPVGVFVGFAATPEMDDG
jgi:hypothetical protein